MEQQQPRNGISRSSTINPQPPQKRQRSLLSWVSSKAATATTTTTTATTRALRPASASAPSSSSSKNYLDGPPGLLSLDAESHVLYLPGLLQGEKEEEEGGKQGNIKKSSFFARLREEVDWLQRSVTVFNRTTPQRRLVAYHSCREQGLRPYNYSGLTLEPVAATPAVMEVLEEVERAAAERLDVFCPPSSSPSGPHSSPVPRLFNSCLLNLYRDGSDCMGWHADDEAVYRSSSFCPSSSSSSSFAKNPSLLTSSSSSSSLLLPPPPFAKTNDDDDDEDEILIASASFGERRDFYLRPKPGGKEKEQGGEEKKKVRYCLGEGDVLLMLGRTQRRWQHSVPARAPSHSKGERINLTFRWNVEAGGVAPRVKVKKSGL